MQVDPIFSQSRLPPKKRIEKGGDGEVWKVELGIRKAEGGIKKRLGERETGG